jgi:RHS repeat-associated protein
LAVWAAIALAAASPVDVGACDDYEEMFFSHIYYDGFSNCLISVYDVYGYVWSSQYDQYLEIYLGTWEEIYECHDPDLNGGGTGTCGPNFFTAFDGNAHREIREFHVPGSVGAPLTWKRFHNTMPRDGADPLGRAGGWRHSWQYELLRMPASSVEAERLQLVQPDGLRRFFRHEGDAWVASPGITDRLEETPEGFEVRTERGSTLRFRRVVAQADRPERFEMWELVDPFGMPTRLEYDEYGSLVRVTDATGKFLELVYREVAFRKGVYHPVGRVPAVSIGGVVEIDIPMHLRERVMHVRLTAASGASLEIHDVELHDDTTRNAVTGRARGRGVARLFREVTAEATRVGVTPTSRPPRPTTVRIVPSGIPAALEGVDVELMELQPTVRRVISEVRGSNGESVGYDYETTVDPETGREYVVLVGARYPDDTRATYRYELLFAYQRPLLVEADDPRYKGDAKRIAYTYQPSAHAGMIRQEINPATGGVYATLELDPDDPATRIISYSDLRTIVYRFDGESGGRPTEYVDSLGRRTTYEYADAGRGPLVAETDHAGRRKVIFYDAAGRFEREELDGRLVARVERDLQGRVVRRIDSAGRETTYARDSVGRIVRQELSDGTVRTFAFDQLGRTVVASDKKGDVYRIAYGADGTRESITNAEGSTVRFRYDARGRMVEKIDPLGRVLRLDRDARGNVAAVHFPDGSTRRFEHDKYGRKIAETDEIGRTKRREYDELSRVVVETDFAGGVTRYDFSDLPQGCGSCAVTSRPSTIRHPDGRVTSVLHDSEGRVLARTENADTTEEATTTYEYDLDDRLVAVTDALGAVTRHAYDAKGHRVSTTDPLGNTTTFTHDEDGRRLSATDPLGRTTRWTFDSRGNVATVTAPDGGVTRHTHDARDRLVQKEDPAGGRTRFDYDTAGNLVAVTDPDGTVTRHEYDVGRRKTATTLADGRRQRQRIDAAGRTEETTSADGLLTGHVHDARDRIVETIDDLGRTTRHTYDPVGRRTSTTDPLGRTTTANYDARNLVVALQRADGVVTRSEYDSAGRLAASIDAAGNTTRYAYNLRGDMVSLTDANGHTYAFSYDKLGRRTAMHYPDGSQESWTYDAGGRVVGHTTRAGQVKTIAYNAAGDPVAEAWTPAGVAPDVAYAYDAAGRLETVSNGAVTLRYSYDALGRVASETSDLSALVPALGEQTVSYRYDANGRPSALVYPDGSTATYAYDALGRLTAVSDGPGRPVAQYVFDKAGRLAGLDRDNGVQTRYVYDMAGQLLEVAHRKGREVLASSSYELDGLGRRVGQTREDGIREGYAYDPTSQLVGVDYGNGRAETFAYDPLGNRIETTESDMAQGETVHAAYTTNNLNQYTRIEDRVVSSGSSLLASRASLLQYDPNGNLIDDGRQRYFYDAQNRLVRVEATDTVSPVLGVFHYDPRNRCVLRQYFRPDARGEWVLQEDESVAMTYDVQWNLLVDRRLDGAQTARYLHGARTDEILRADIARASGSASRRSRVEAFYPLADGLGSTVVLADDRGRIEQRYRYAAFGSPDVLASGRASSARGSSFRFLFTGREWISQHGLAEHRFRYFSPGLGRWLANDPIRHAGGLNLYGYSGNSAANAIDPSGLAWSLERVSGNGFPMETWDVNGAFVWSVGRRFSYGAYVQTARVVAWATAEWNDFGQIYPRLDVQVEILLGCDSSGRVIGDEENRAIYASNQSVAAAVTLESDGNYGTVRYAVGAGKAGNVAIQLNAKIITLVWSSGANKREGGGSVTFRCICE